MYTLPVLALIGGAVASPLATSGKSVAGVGSSYAYGAGLERSETIGAQIQKTLGFGSFDNVAISGSKLDSIYKTQAPKLKGKSPDLIYMVSGGNDLAYVSCLANPTLNACSHPEPQATWQKDFEAALDSVFKNVANPTETTLYVVTYPVAIGPATHCAKDNKQCPIASQSEVDRVQKLYNDQVDWTVAGLKDWQGKAANKNFKTKLIAMRKNSQGHEVGSSDPWVRGANGAGAPWHPNPAGAKSIAGFITADFK